MSALDTAVDPRDARIRELEAEVERLRAKVPLDPEVVGKEARRRFLKFIVSRVNPGFEARHHGNLASWNRGLWQEAGQLGLIGFNAPKEIGGEGKDSATWNLTLEELAKLVEDPGFFVLAMIQKNWATMIHTQGRADLVEKYSKPLIRGDISLCWAIWEPADPATMHSEARKVEGGWSLTGHKPIILGAMYASVFAVVVREATSSEPMLFFVERGDKGVEVKPLPTLGGHHIGYASLTLKDTFVPDERLFIDVDALATTSMVFNDGILNGMAIHVGWMQRMFALCVEELRTKVRVGQRVIDLPHVQAELGRLHMGIELSRSIFLRTLEKYRQGAADPFSEPLALILKHFVTERALDTARTLITLQGAAGYMDDNPWGRYLTHVTGLLHLGGAHDLVPVQVGARHLLDLEMRRLRRVGL